VLVSKVIRADCLFGGLKMNKTRTEEGYQMFIPLSAPHHVPEYNPNFSHHLCNCCAAGCLHCFKGFVFPMCAQAEARNRYDGTNFFFNCFCLNTAATYNIIREGYGLEGDCCTDIMIGGLCPCCAIIRLHAEIDARGPHFKRME